MRICLRVTAGPHEGREFTFAGHDTFIVGRSQRAHFRLSTKDRFFSRVHFMVELNPPQCRLMDLGSRNGTYVNGERVKVTDLKDGDQIKAGKTILRVKVEGSAPVVEVPPTLLPRKVTPPASPSPPPPPVREAVGLCRACAAPVAPELAASRAPLCPACQEKVRNLAQPITGYQLVQELGRGGMGVVYLAVSTADGARVALKTIIPAVAGSRTDIERFLREASILCQLGHPNIVGFREMGEANGQLYFAMDYVPGTDAGRLLKAHGPLPARRAVALVCQLLEALEYAHAKGYVHRDIKPANLLVTEVGGREVAKLADFGLARVYQTSRLSGLTMMGDRGGTIAFVAPEQLTHFRDAKPAVDQYSAGATLYNLLTQRFVYDLPKQAEKRLLMILQDNPVPIQARGFDIPPPLADIIHRALARDPEARFADVKEMRQALIKACR
jgi:serine/threonine-protein kinase